MQEKPKAAQPKLKGSLSSSASAAEGHTLGASLCMTVKTSMVKQAGMAEQVNLELSMAQGPACTTVSAASRPAATCGAARSSSRKPSQQASAALQLDVTKLSSAALQGVRPTRRKAAQTEQSAVKPDSSAVTPSATIGATAGLHGEVQHTAQQSVVSAKRLALRSEVNSSPLAAVIMIPAAAVEPHLLWLLLELQVTALMPQTPHSWEPSRGSSLCL